MMPIAHKLWKAVMTIFKKQFQSTIILVIVFCIALLPINVVALEPQPTTETKTRQTSSKKEAVKTSATQAVAKTEANRSTTTCKSIDQLATKVQSQLSERKTKVDSKRIDIYVKTSTHRENRDTELVNKRADWDTKRQENFDTLRAKAKTDEQKQAVEDYVTAITEAIKTRRMANDIAFMTFKNTVDDLKKTISESVNGNISTTTASINQTITDAKVSCASGQSADTVRQTVKSKLEAARQRSKADRESITKNDLLKAATQKRNDDIKLNNEAFKTSTTVAREQLKTAFKE